MDNILEIKKHPLFNDELRKQMYDNINGKEVDPNKIISTIESTLCTYIIVIAKAAGVKLANALTNKLFSKEKR